MGCGRPARDERGACAGAARAWECLAEPGGRMRHRQERQGRRAGLDSAGRTAARRDGSPRARRRRGQGRDGLCNARTVLSLGEDAALRRGAERGRGAPGRGFGRGPGPAGCRRRSRAIAGGRDRRRKRAVRRRGGRDQCRVLPARANRPAARHAETGDLARRADRDRFRGKPLDYRPGGARAYASAACHARCDPGRDRDGAGRRSAADLPP